MCRQDLVLMVGRVHGIGLFKKKELVVEAVNRGLLVCRLRREGNPMVDRRQSPLHNSIAVSNIVTTLNSDLLMKPPQWLFPYHNLPVGNHFSRSVAAAWQRSPFSSNTANPATRRYRPLQVLHDANIDRFREGCFTPEVPAVLPRRHFRDLPAVERWFRPSSIPNVPRLNTNYLEQHGAHSFVPLELTQLPSEPATPNQVSREKSDSDFRQFHAPLSLFLQWMRTAETQPQSTRLYLAQCQLLDLPPALRDDFPIPDLVARAGKGDVYDTNVWIGHPPTYTLLHRDPNPNLFVQLAGRKVVRLLAPDDGHALFALVRRRLGKSGDRGAAVFRGEDMMQGQERLLLEQAVWGNSESKAADDASGPEGYEAHLDAGDGMFIPKGWWHSIKGVGEGVTASVSVLVFCLWGSMLAGFNISVIG